jgi:uncharacterized coiled-coil protein SlyX
MVLTMMKILTLLSMMGISSISSAQRILNPIDQARKFLAEQDASVCDSAKVGLDQNFPLVNLGPAKCWANRKTASDFKGEKVDQMKLLFADEKICNCINDENKFFPITGEVQKYSFAPTPDYKLPKDPAVIYALNAKKLQEELAEDKNRLAFQASIISESNAEFTKYYGPAASTQVSSKEVMDKLSGIIDFGKDPNADLASKIKNSIEALKIPPNVPPASSYLVDPPFAENQCVGVREYLAYKQLPSDKDIIKEISSGKFVPEDWNHYVLRKKYDSLMAEKDVKKRNASKEEVLKLSNKLRFLSQNPMLKTFFAADASADYLSYTDKMSKEREEFATSVMKKNAKTLPKLKNKLFDILKLSVNPDQKQSNKYKEQLKQFFVDKDHAQVMDVEIEKEAYKKLERLTDSRALKVTAPALTQDSVMRDFTKISNLETPDICSQGGASVEKCSKIFAGYCKAVTQAVRSLPCDNNEVFDELDSLISNDLNPDFKSNADFQKFNSEICDKTRLADSTGDGSNSNNFKNYKDKYCKANAGSVECSHSPDKKNIVSLRDKFLAKFPYSLASGHSAETFLNYTKDQITDVPGGKSLFQDTDKAARRSSRLAALQDQWGRLEGLDKSNDLDQSAYNMAGTAPASTNSNAFSDSQSASVPDTSFSNFANAAVASAGAAPQTIDNMNDDKKRDMLDDMKKDYADWKADKTTNNGSQTASAQETAMKSRIEALEQLLAQQKKISDEQYKLLNDTIAERNKDATKKVVAESGASDEAASNKAQKIANADTTNASNISDVSRAPASAPQYSTGGVNSGSNGSAVTKRSNANSADTSADSVAREESKLANVRRFPDGSVSIEAASQTSGAATANAIIVTVTDEQYDLLSANPDGLNLAQLEKDIPQDQIAKLEKNGEITIFLKNGPNQPFEVKVEKINNKLVYRKVDKSGNPVVSVKRVYTRQSLELQLKAQQ